jgi:cytochrome P450
MMFFHPSQSPFNPFDPEIIADPYPSYQALRALDPVHTGINELRFVSRFTDVLTVLSDDKQFIRGEYALQLLRNYGSNSLSEITRHMLFLLDPPDHERIRRLVTGSTGITPFFSPAYVDRLADRIRSITNELLATLIASGKKHIDLIDDFAFPLPIAVICEILGIPQEDRLEFRRLSRDFTRIVDPVVSQEVVDRAIEASDTLQSYFKDLIARRRRTPHADMVSELIQYSDQQGDHLTEQEVLSTCVLFLMSGHENITNLIGLGALTFLEHPDQLALLRRDPSLYRQALVELLRYDCPSQYNPREALVDVRLSDTIIPAGSLVIALIGSANRDEQKYQDPDQFRINRFEKGGARETMSFGRGINYCLGAPLTLVEGQIALQALFEQLQFSIEIPREQLQCPRIAQRGVICS